MLEKYKYKCSNRPIGQSLAKFGGIHTNFEFGGKFYPRGIPMGILYLLTEPDF